MEVIEALARSGTFAEAAKTAGVDRSTIYLWTRGDDDFKGQLIMARRECADTMRARLREPGDDAGKTLQEIAKSTEVSPAVRLAAVLAAP